MANCSASIDDEMYGAFTLTPGSDNVLWLVVCNAGFAGDISYSYTITVTNNGYHILANARGTHYEKNDIIFSVYCCAGFRFYVMHTIKRNR